MKPRQKFYVHHRPGREINSFSSTFTLLEEHSLPVGSRTLLYLLAETRAGSLCCGAGTLRYILVPGWIIEASVSTDREGQPVSIVASVDREKESNHILSLLSDKYPSLQVCFW